MSSYLRPPNTSTVVRRAWTCRQFTINLLTGFIICLACIPIEGRNKKMNDIVSKLTRFISTLISAQSHLKVSLSTFFLFQLSLAPLQHSLRLVLLLNALYTTLYIFVSLTKIYRTADLQLFIVAVSQKYMFNANLSNTPIYYRLSKQIKEQTNQITIRFIFHCSLVKTLAEYIIHAYWVQINEHSLLWILHLLKKKLWQSGRCSSEKYKENLPFNKFSLQSIRSRSRIRTVQNAYLWLIWDEDNINNIKTKPLGKCVAELALFEVCMNYG